MKNESRKNTFLNLFLILSPLVFCEFLIFLTYDPASSLLTVLNSVLNLNNSVYKLGCLHSPNLLSQFSCNNLIFDLELRTSLFLNLIISFLINLFTFYKIMGYINRKNLFFLLTYHVIIFIVFNISPIFFFTPAFLIKFYFIRRGWKPTRVGDFFIDY